VKKLRPLDRLSIAVVVAAVIVALAIFLRPCCVYPGVSLVKVFEWDTGGVVIGQPGDSLTIWLELGGSEVQGSRQTLTTGQWRVVWNGLEHRTYDIVYEYTHAGADPSSGSGRESVTLKCQTTVKNKLKRAKPNG